MTWKPLSWQGKNYLLVPSSFEKGSCSSCCFEKDDACPRYEGPRQHIICVALERATGKEAHFIPDTPEAIANYIAQHLSA